jgi:hypothetical protein
MHNIYIYIYTVIIKNNDHTSGLALGRRGVIKVSQRLLGLLHEDLLLVLLDDLLVLMIANGHDLRQFILYMHVRMMQ